VLFSFLLTTIYSCSNNLEDELILDENLDLPKLSKSIIIDKIYLDYTIEVTKFYDNVKIVDYDNAIDIIYL
jgi:hypothetical protein